MKLIIARLICTLIDALIVWLLLGVLCDMISPPLPHFSYWHCLSYVLFADFVVKPALIRIKRAAKKMVSKDKTKG